MFKKAFKTSSNNNLSGKDRKKLIGDLSKYYDPESVNLLLAKNNSDIVVNKLQGMKAQIYSMENIPIIVDASGKGEYFPTIYAFQLFPNLTKPIEINSGVETYLMGGANLMWPGVRNIKNLGNFSKDDITYVKSSDNRIIAVGAMSCSSQELASKGATGTAMFILHVIEDKLWALGPKKDLDPVSLELKKEDENKQENNLEEVKNEEEKLAETQVEKVEEKKVDKDEDDAGDEIEEEEKVAGAKDEAQSVSVKEMEEYLMEAFLTALKISVTEKDLPMDAGDFYSNHILACKKEGVFIDVKNTSYKKIGKFLQAMAKLGIIDFKESKKGGAPQITRINKLNPKLKDFAPVVSKPAKKEVKEEEVSEDDKWPKIQIVELFKLKPQLHVTFFLDNPKLLFVDDVPSKEKLYTRDEVQNVIQKYLITNKLADKKWVKLDTNLRPLFWVQRSEEKIEKTGPGDMEESKKDQSNQPPEFTLTREELFKRVGDYLFPHHKIIDLQTGEEDIKQGAFKGVTMVAEKSHNKNITSITGLETFKFNIPSLVNKFQLKYACSVSTHIYSEKGVEKTEIIVHGNFIDKISDYFADECKIERKYINCTNKLEKKKK